MRFLDTIDHSLGSLKRKKLRTFLTTFGVVIGIGALVSMVSFGLGVERNVTDQFRRLELFNYVMAFSGNSPLGGFLPGSSRPAKKTVLNEESLKRIRALKGVETAFPDARFPASLRMNDKEEFGFVQILPVDSATQDLMRLRAGSVFPSEDARSAVVSDTFLRRVGIRDVEAAVGRTIEIASFYFDFARLERLDFSGELPVGREVYTLEISGVSSRMGMSGALPIRSDVFITQGTAGGMKKLVLNSLWDLFSSGGDRQYSQINVRVDSPSDIEPVKAELEEMGLQTFALIDQLEEIKTGFIFLDMILAAVGMIAIVVAALGIINTMVMSILERYAEIGVMKAVGASDRDVKKIFFFESGTIGFMGGLCGYALGWVVSQIINMAVNSYLGGQGMPHFSYFSYPWWLFVGAVAFALLVSLAAGIYPAARAARVDPVVALRHN
jgi:putative ABC transport system permease protein